MFMNRIFYNSVKNISNSIFKMSIDARLNAVPLVEIDTGIFKYVLIKVYGKEDSNGQESQKSIVRGFLRAEWHADIYEEVSSSIRALGLDCECLGGGRIEHKKNEKRIKVYGYSQGYGKADHEEAKKILLTKYRDYHIECSDEALSNLGQTKLLLFKVSRAVYDVK